MAVLNRFIKGATLRAYIWRTGGIDYVLKRLMTVLYVFLSISSVLCYGESQDQKAALPSFPGAEGFGAVATGGRGGKVVKVTNLNASGPGSLQWACSRKGPKIIVFDVSGVITPPRRKRNEHNLALRRDDITIAGQTAPGAGITIIGSVTSQYPDFTDKTYKRSQIRADYSKAGSDTNVENVIIRFLRIRTDSKCAISPGKSTRIMVDHVSGSWGSDQCYNACSTKNFTYQWCANEETDPFLEGTEPHGFAMLNSYSADGTLSLHHNLIVSHTGRSPCIDTTYRPDVINNVFYNVGFVERYMRWLYGRRYPDKPFAMFNVIGNYWKDGPGGMIGIRANYPPHTSSQQGFASTGACKFFYDGNHFAWDGYVGKEKYSGGRAKYLAEKRWPTEPFGITTHTAEEAYELQMAHVGCLPRDSVSARIIAETRTGTGEWGVHVPDAGLMEGLTPAKALPDADNDGMPDEWEKAHKLDPNDPADSSRTVPAGASARDRHKGYTYIEYYINELADRKIAAALTEYRLQTEPPKPWDKPATKLLPRVAIHKSLDEMVNAVREQNAEIAKDKRKRRRLSSAWFAIQQLSRMGEKAGPAVPELARGLAKGKEDPRAVTFAAWSLGAIGPAAGDAVPELIKALKAEQSVTIGKLKFPPYGFIAWALGRIGMNSEQAKEAVPVLAGLLKGKDTRALNNAAWALRKAGKDAEPALPALLDVLGLGRYPSMFTGFFAARALANIGKPAVPGLIKAVGSSDEYTRFNAARALGWMGKDAGEAVPGLIAQLGKEQTGKVRARIAEALAKIAPDNKKVVTALSGILGDPFLEVRVSAANALGDCGASAAGAVSALVKAFKDERRETGRAAALALGRTGKAALPALTQAMSKEEAYVRKYAARAMSEIGREAVPALIKALSDRDAEVRREAVWALGRIGGDAKQASAAVEKMKQDVDYVVRYAAGEVGMRIEEVSSK